METTRRKKQIVTTLMDNLDHIKNAAIEEFQEVVRIKHVNMEVLQYLTSSLRERQTPLAINMKKEE